jgi:branched-chain amino acid transport system substrate-binding protein
MPGYPAFLAAYQAAGFAHESNDPGFFGPYSYDAARIIIAAIDRAESIVPADIRDEIAAMTNHAGVVGTYIGFDANGDVIPQWAWLVRFKNG